MMDRLVVCFCWRDRDTPPEAYIQHHNQVLLELAQFGAESISWGADRYAFALADECDVADLVAAVLSALRRGLAHSAGACRRPLSASSGHYWGPALMVAEHLALSARHTEVLLDMTIESVARGELATSGTLTTPLGELSVEAAAMVATASERPVRRSSLPPPEVALPHGARRSSLPPLEPPEPVTVRRAVVDTPERGDDDASSMPAALQSAPLGSSHVAGGAVLGASFEESSDTDVVDRSTITGFPQTDFSSMPPNGLVEPEVDALFDPDAIAACPPADDSGARAAPDDTEPVALPDDDEVVSLPDNEAVSLPDNEAVSLPDNGSAPGHSSPHPGEGDEITRQVPAVTDQLMEGLASAGPEDSASLPPAADLPTPPRSVGRQLSNPPPKPKPSAPPRRLSNPPPKPRTSAPPPRLSEPPPKPMMRAPNSVDSDSGAEADAAAGERYAVAVTDERSSDLTARLEGMAELAGGDVEVGLLRLREAVTLAAHGEESQARLALAVGLVKAGQPQVAVVEAMHALGDARKAHDRESERHCAKLLARLAQSAGQHALSERWSQIAEAGPGSSGGEGDESQTRG